MRRRGLSIPREDYAAVKGLPADWDFQFIRDRLMHELDDAERYVLSAPVEITGLLATDADDTPVEARSTDLGDVILRRATEEPEVMPQPSSGMADWRR